MAVAIIPSFIAGCIPPDLNTPTRRARGLLVVLPGIEGPSVWNRDLILGLRDGGIDCAIERYEWGTPVPAGFLINLTDIAGNRAAAARLRDHLVSYMDEFPNRPVVLVGHSGGAGIALMATGMLPRDRPVTAMFLLAAAVSPEFDLRGALANTHGTIVNCYSERDELLLGAGTTIAGTMDRRHGESAGKVGFRVPGRGEPGDDRRFDRLIQIPWTVQMSHLGNPGGHAGCTDRGFVRRWLAPRVRRHLHGELTHE